MNVKVRMLICISLISILVAIIGVADIADEMRHTPEYTDMTDAVFTESGVFYAENWNGKGRVYRIKESGEVLAMTNSGGVSMDSVRNVSVFDGKLYVLYSSKRSDKDGDYPVYRIACYDANLELLSVSDLFTIDSSMKVCSLSADSVFMYISAISENGGSVSVYSVPVRMLQGGELPDEEEKDASEESREDFATPNPIHYRERTLERFYVDARYKDAELFALLDGDQPTGVFAPDIRVKTAVDALHFSFGQKLSLNANLIIKCCGFFLIWLILVCLTIKLTKDRNRIVYLFLASEIVLFLILFATFSFIRQQYQKIELKNHIRYAEMVLQEDLSHYRDVDFDAADYYDSAKYFRLMENLTEVMNQRDNENLFLDIFVMRSSTGVILADAAGHCRVHASYLYGGELSTLIEELKTNVEPVSVPLTLEGIDYTAVSYKSENPKDDITLVAICRNMNDEAGYREAVRGLRILFILVFVVGSGLLFLVLYLPHTDLKRFSKALHGLAMGKPKEDSPKVLSRDMRELWQSYGELSKRIEKINYDMYMIYEAYYRFAPKGIEEIMGKESILDVRNGNVVSVSGSMVLLSIGKDEDFKKKVRTLSAILTNMENYARDNEGVMVSRDPSLSNIRFLLLKERGDTVTQIVQSINAGSLMKVNNMSVMMYKDRIDYGVAGSATQSLTYIDSVFSTEMDAFAAWFRKLGALVVVTDDIVSVEDVGEKRFVGKAIFEKSKSEVRFYEVLDAYPAKVRQMMLVNRAKFEETLELFYSKDFYLARNQFMDILKECPEDGITK